MVGIVRTATGRTGLIVYLGSSTGFTLESDTTIAPIVCCCALYIATAGTAILVAVCSIVPIGKAVGMLLLLAEIDVFTTCTHIQIYATLRFGRRGCDAHQVLRTGGCSNMTIDRCYEALPIGGVARLGIVEPEIGRARSLSTIQITILKHIGCYPIKFASIAPSEGVGTG